MSESNYVLPWNDGEVGEGHEMSSCDHARESLARRCAREFVGYLPQSVTVVTEPGVDPAEVVSFFNGASTFIAEEMQLRWQRRRRFIAMGLLSESEIDAALTCAGMAQPWIIYLSRTGGLGESGGNPVDSRDVGGLVVCSSMTNHGVAWRRQRHGQMTTWLITARKEGQPWDWDSDLGHRTEPMPASWYHALTHPTKSGDVARRAS